MENPVVVSEFTRAEDRLQVAQTQPGSLLQAITVAASNPSVDMDKMERLWAMHRQMVEREAESVFNAAMARAQAKIVPIANNASNNQTNSRYAKLAAINKEITPIYTAEGLSISFDSGDSGKPDLQRVIAIVAHSGGHKREYHIDLPADAVGAKGNVNKTAVHATGSTNSYARRYLVCMIFNVTTEDDNDGNAPKIAAMGDDDIEEYMAKIAALTDKRQGESLWQIIASVCTKYGDVSAYDALKGAMAAKIKALKEPAGVL